MAERPSPLSTAQRAKRWRIGFDIGGTFTDFVLNDAEQEKIILHKALTSPADPSVAALQGLEEIVGMAGIALADIHEIVHGTTLVTNAIIERKGARLGLITTRGFRDVLEMGTEQRYDIYDLFLKFPEPLVARAQRLEMAERMDRDGNIITAIDHHEIRKLLRTLVDAGCEAVAVCFINAYRNDAHEKAVARLAAAEFPRLAVSISSAVVPEMWEYQRCVTTCANAYVQPLMDTYIARLQTELAARGFAGSLRLMHSAAGWCRRKRRGLFPFACWKAAPPAVASRQPCLAKRLVRRM